MNTKYKALLLTLCVILLVSAAVFGTVAYFTDTEAATNTFVVGKVGISLDEAKVNENGKPVDKDGNVVADLATAERVKGNAYHLVPGYIYTKDPTVTVEEGSSESYVRMMVKVGGLDSLKAAMPIGRFPTFYNEELFLLQNLCMDENANMTWDSTKWQFKKFHTEGTYANCYEFRYNTTVDGKDGDTDKAETLPALFTKITVPGEVDNTGIEKLKDVQIIVTAHAIQAAGFNTAEAAWAAFDAQTAPNL